MNIFRILPFTYPWIIRRHLGDVKTILDVGCGDGTLVLMVNYDKKYAVTGVDLFEPYLKKARNRAIYKHLVLGDVRKLNFKDKSFDAVLSSQVVEHLNTTEALKLIHRMEKIARKKVIIGTTNGFFRYDPLEGKDNNPLQVHKSGWGIKVFLNLGYKVYGQGMGIIYKPGGLAYRVKSLTLLLFAISYLLSPLNYFFPKFSAYLITIKDKYYE